MTLLYTSPRFLEHHTGQHPECAARLEHILARLDEGGLSARCTRPDWEPAKDAQLTEVHERSMVRGLERMADTGGGYADPDTVVGRESVDVAKLAAGAVCDAVSQVLAGADPRALCLVRPPGHHALRDTAMGFCLFNNIAVAARAALDHGLHRVLVIDWDVHHGNGTQAIFYDEPRVGFFSVHRWPFYPGTGTASETGTGKGLGTTRNLPVIFGTSRTEYQQLVLRELEDFAAKLKPELVLVSAGFDAHHSDPVGSLGLEVEDFEWLTQAAVDIANTHAKGRLVSALEGGYNPPVLAECVATHLEVLLNAK
ncbi:MAG: histone deacetylase [Bythopirellula sp.]|nr:histone deacetylase [Bythopirellula sp.]